jgi:hypothetical protein
LQVLLAGQALQIEGAAQSAFRVVFVGLGRRAKEDEQHCAFVVYGEAGQAALVMLDDALRVLSKGMQEINNVGRDIKVDANFSMPEVTTRSANATCSASSCCRAPAGGAGEPSAAAAAFPHSPSPTSTATRQRTSARSPETVVWSRSGALRQQELQAMDAGLDIIKIPPPAIL